ncbi:casein kinase II beta 2 subunit [Apiospora saccharicola]|uniref:Casein kinase II beta 2 subunit n=1 Tax=Apiospora saccharicola TaxID=335842 RepID=A0ABR1WHF1_9PEZI
MVAPLGGIWAPSALRMARQAVYKASKVIRAKLVDTARPVNTALEPVFARSTPRQPIHPAALLRQQKSRRWHSTSTYQTINYAVRRFMSTGRLSEAPRIDRAKFNATQVGRAISKFTGRAPFASTLRPNLTGGALPRTAGGYGLGSGRIGGARYFSHTPAAQAQVVNNVSAAVRAFWISGQKAQFDGLTERGERRYRSVSALQDETARKMASVSRITTGSYVDFKLNPTVTALSPLAGAFPFAAAGTKVPLADAATLNAEGFFDVLSVDFGRALQDLTVTLGDLQKLAALGDLPIQLEKGHTIRVRFPGVDADTVEMLCYDLEISRGIVEQDVDFEAEAGVAMALKFPFAPDDDGEQSRALLSPGGSLRSLGGFAEDELFEAFDEVENNSWLASPEPEGYESMSPPISSGEHCSDDFEGLQGVYRFLGECDRAQGRF